jgi:hypothetical protein
MASGYWLSLFEFHYLGAPLFQQASSPAPYVGVQTSDNKKFQHEIIDHDDGDTG